LASPVAVRGNATAATNTKLAVASKQGLGNRSAFTALTLARPIAVLAADATSPPETGATSSFPLIDLSTSLDIYLQHESPGTDKEANWLPAPTGGVKPMLRMYWPKQPVLSGTWVPSPIQKQPPSAATHSTTPPM
jgi:hypothetical protein